MRCSKGIASILCCSVLFASLLSGTSGGDTITQPQPFRDGTTLTSLGRTFELGFFRCDNTNNRYLGIWFASSNATVAWVANRGHPLSDSSGVLSIDSATGNLLLTNGANATVWSSGLPPSAGTNRVARLLDSGNLVLTDDGDSTSVIWQSFDYPSDTMVAGMKLGLDYKAGLNRSLTSWKSPNDPAQGDYAFVMDPRGVPQLFVRNLLTSVITYRSGPWNGLGFSGIPAMMTYDMFNFTVVITANEAYYQFGVTNSGISARLLLDSSGTIQRLVAKDQKTWNSFWKAPQDQCDKYMACGPHGVCDPNSAFICDCLPGFQVKNRDEWYMRNWNSGCVRRTSQNCSGGDGFLLVQQVKLPDTVNCTLDTTMGLADCEAACLRNCSCTAYATANVKNGSGCVMWTGNLIDIRRFTDDGQDVYIRLAASEIAAFSRTSPKNQKLMAAILVAVLLGSVLMGSGGYYMWRKRTRKTMTTEGGARTYYADESLSREDPDVPLFDFDEISQATNNFNDENKIGEGGFGAVYKGNLKGEQDVAVKRLSLNSAQGVHEFKNEVTLIAKLQHRNLVRLLGCSMKERERLLVYEYMPNNSLDFFIFADDDRKRLSLDWRKRLDIIFGVARGLLYLHQDSRLRIIHRDLKAGNILLDMDMNPKISDFGTAKIFGGDETEVTRKVVGTYGYMSPEYAMGGVFSVKSDVFSFGVLVLEILSGRKNRWIPQANSRLNLLAHAWSLWKEDRSLELLEDRLPCPCPFSEVQRWIQVGLLCVQEASEDRPSMQQVVLMLGTDNSHLPQPKHPGFFTLSLTSSERYTDSGSHEESNSAYLMTVTNLEGR